MKKINLGDTGIKVSPIGLGTVKFGRNQDVKYPHKFELPTKEHLVDLLTLAKSLGINLIDTAPAYGLSEEKLGSLLKGQREDWIIVSKVGEEFVNGQSSYHFTSAHFEMSLKRSLNRLNTNYIDVLLIHADKNDVNILQNEALIEKLHDFKKRGLVRAIGASTRSVNAGIQCLRVMDVVMAAYNPNYKDEEPVLDYAAKHNKGVILKKVLSSGHDTNIQTAFKFSLNHPCSPSAIIGTINPKHLQENVGVVENVLADKFG